MKNIELNFDKRFASGVPDTAKYSGIYVVYAYNSQSGSWKLLDIGQAVNMYERHLKHERKSQWEKVAKETKSDIYIYTAEISNEHSHRDVAEAALLYKFKPLCATDGKQGYHHGDVKIVVKGMLAKAFGVFTVCNEG